MNQTAEAIIEPNGTVRLLSPLPVTTPTRATVTVMDAVPTAHERQLPRTLAEALQRMKDAKTPEELFAAASEAAPFETPDPEGYDLGKALEENRKEPWFRPLDLKALGHDDE